MLLCKTTLKTHLYACFRFFNSAFVFALTWKNVSSRLMMSQNYVIKFEQIDMKLFGCQMLSHDLQIQFR